MKPRATLPASEVEQLWSRLERQLDSAGLQTQPEVAGQVLELVSNPASNLRDFARVIRGDAPLSGRLLRFANSAYFAQRQPVSNLERACVLLGLERLKAISLGFFLSRAASDPDSAVSRQIWGESVYRACIAAELAKDLVPRYQPEAFVIGLMLDSGIPLMHRLMGEPYGRLLRGHRNPGELFKAEWTTLPYTHVDIVAALARRWRLPELLARPLQHHHVPPTPSGRKGEHDNVVQRLQRLAYFVGALRLQVDPVTENIRQPELIPAAGGQVLGIDSYRLQQLISRASDEYSALQEVFRDVAESVTELTEVSLRVHQQLVAITDQVILNQLSIPSPSAACFSIAGQRVEVEVDTLGRAVAYLSDNTGARLLSYNFKPEAQSARRILEGLGLEGAVSGDTEGLETFLRAIAA